MDVLLDFMHRAGPFGALLVVLTVVSVIGILARRGSHLLIENRVKWCTRNRH